MPRAGRVLGFIVLLLFFASASNAVASPPILTAAGQTDDHPSASWTLPASEQIEFIEVATASDTGTDGYFFMENVVAADIPASSATAWLSSSQLAPGTYYVHVQGEDTNSFAFEWSNILTFVIPAPPPAPATIYVYPSGSGAIGTVTSDPVGISCAIGTTSCSANFVPGTTVTLTATPGVGSLFQDWIGATCSGSSPVCSFVAPGAVTTISAFFGVAPVAKPVPPAPVTTTPTPTPTPIATLTVGKARLSFSMTATGISKTRFTALQSKIYVTVKWSTLPVPNRSFRLIWVRPNGKSDGTSTSRSARLGSATHAFVPNGDFRSRAGKWTVRLMVGTSVVASASFTVARPV